VRQVLVLGSSGFIGRRVSLALAGADWASLVSDDARGPPGMDAGARRIVVNVEDPGSMAAALRGIDTVVNCLGGKPETIVRGARALFAAAGRAVAPPLVVHLSSMAVYGSAQGTMGEDAPLRGDLGAYASAQIAAESSAASYPRVVILRPGVEIGPDGESWSGRVARWLYAGRLGDLGPAGDGVCNLVHVEDLVTAIIICSQRREALGGTFNLAMSEPPTWNEYFIAFARQLGAVPVRRISRRALILEAKGFAVPLKALELAARAAGLPALSPPPIPPSLLRLARQEIRLDCRRAARVLDWTCRSREAALADAAAGWHRDAAGRPLRVGKADRPAAR